MLERSWKNSLLLSIMRYLFICHLIGLNLMILICTDMEDSFLNTSRFVLSSWLSVTFFNFFCLMIIRSHCTLLHTSEFMYLLVLISFYICIILVLTNLWCEFHANIPIWKLLTEKKVKVFNTYITCCILFFFNWRQSFTPSLSLPKCLEAHFVLIDL